MELGKKFVSAEILERICIILKVSPSALFYSADILSLDNSKLSTIDRIIDEQAKATRKMIREAVK
jgi:hypothetical protein